MTTVKHLILLTIIILYSFKSFAQSDTINNRPYYDPNIDTIMVPKKRMTQHNEFLNNTYYFPSKPRNQWEIGINIGEANISGDVRTKTFFNAAQGALPFGFGATIRKSFGYVISSRLQFIHGVASGYNHEKSKRHWGHDGNPWSTLDNAYYFRKGIYDNYRTTINELTLQTVFSLNNLKFHTNKTKFNFYAIIGLGGMSYYTKINALNGTTPYDFEAIDYNLNTTTNRTTWEKRKEITKRLNAMYDKTFETDAEINANRGTAGGKATFRGVGTFGAGIQFKLSNKLTLQLEDKATWTSDDLLDGVRWQGPSRDLVTGNLVAGQMTRDMDTWNYFSIGLNINLGNKASVPLWWINPLVYPYRELKSDGVKSDGKCDIDNDKDGISDCYDLCPNTSKGVNVDAHGCPMDTDGDGIPDYKDKQLITPTECQPSNADGVGVCPDPDCCMRGTSLPLGCGNSPIGKIQFINNSSKIQTQALSSLNNLTSSMRNSPNCKVVIIGNGSGSKMEQQRSWDRVYAVINYLVEKQGIDRDRFIFNYGLSGDSNDVEFRFAANGEEGPSNLPPPFPNLKK